MPSQTTPLPVANPTSLDDAVRYLRGRRLVVLTGAGMSTDSGVPAYRGTNSRPRNPMTYQEFRSSAIARQRFWARSHVGFAIMSQVEPNPGHRALAELSAQIEALITQNVDGLHEAAGSSTIALHGRIAEVMCLDCGHRSSRSALQERMSAANPGYLESHYDRSARPDGDVDLSDTADFVVPACAVCGGELKPDVIFFGENVPHDRRERCIAAIEALDPQRGAMLVLGSSLTVRSGLRLVRHALDRAVPVVLVNRGPTGADHVATARVEAGCTQFLLALAKARDSPDTGA